MTVFDKTFLVGMVGKAEEIMDLKTEIKFDDRKVKPIKITIREDLYEFEDFGSALGFIIGLIHGHHYTTGKHFQKDGTWK